MRQSKIESTPWIRTFVNFITTLDWRLFEVFYSVGWFRKLDYRKKELRRELFTSPQMFTPRGHYMSRITSRNMRQKEWGPFEPASALRFQHPLHEETRLQKGRNWRKTFQAGFLFFLKSSRSRNPYYAYHLSIFARWQPLELMIIDKNMHKRFRADSVKGSPLLLWKTFQEML